MRDLEINGLTGEEETRRQYEYIEKARHNVLISFMFYFSYLSLLLMNHRYTYVWVSYRVSKKDVVIFL